MALKLISQNAETLFEAYHARKKEYETLRAGEQWSGAILHAGTLVELALKLVICKNLGVTQLPVIFQVHDLELLLYCTGQQSVFSANLALQENFRFIRDRWSMALRYEGAVKTKEHAEEFDQALFDQVHGVISCLSQYF